MIYSATDLRPGSKIKDKKIERYTVMENPAVVFQDGIPVKIYFTDGSSLLALKKKHNKYNEKLNQSVA